LRRLEKVRRERDFNALPFNSIPVDVEEVFLHRAAWVVNCRAARVIADVHLPLVPGQAQDAGLLGVTQGNGAKQDKTL
jgi:hypothetical protein